MSCSCGNTTCPCGIPCYCSEESCKCPACEIALHRFCKLCNKPLITDIQTDKEACSCFVGEAVAMFNQDNSKFIMESKPMPIPMPVGYFACAKLVTDVMIPVLSFPPLIHQRPIRLMLPPSIQSDSVNISPSFTSNEDKMTWFPIRNDSDNSPTEESHKLDNSSGQANYHNSCVQSEDEREIAQMEMKKFAALQESFRHCSIKDDNIANPVRGSSNPELCVTGCHDLSQKLCGKEFRRPDLNNRAQDSATVIQLNEQPLDLANMIGQSGLKIHGKRKKYKDSLSNATYTRFTVLPSSGNSKSISLTGKCASSSLQPNEASEKYLTHDGKSVDASTDISISKIPELSPAQSRPVCAARTSGVNQEYLHNGQLDCGIEKSAMDGELIWEVTDFGRFHQIPSNTQMVPEYVGAPNIASKLQPLFNKSSAESSKGNKNPQNGRPSYPLVNKRVEETDPIPLYIDTSTTQHMEKLLNSAKHLSATSSIFC